MQSQDSQTRPLERQNTTTSRDLSKDGHGKNFQQRVEEFAMWKDEATFQDMEYKRRRAEKKKMKGTIRSDRLLILSNRLYIPTIGLIVISSIALLLSSLEGLGEDTFLWNHQKIFQILGGVFLTIGIIALMAVAAYSYHREDKVRARCGYPSLFTSSMKGETSTKNMEESFMVHNTFVDKPRRYAERVSRLNSVESRCTGNALGQSFSSTSTAMSWVHKHREYTDGLTRKPSLRRENSDSALDKIFARNRLLNWQMEGSVHLPGSGDNDDVSTDNSEQTNSNVGEMTCDTKEHHKVGDVSQIESSVSMASSGYCSNTSTQCLSHAYKNYNKNHRQPLSRHLSEPSRKVTVHYIAERDRMFSEGIIPDEENFEEQQRSVVPNIPIINIECV